MTLPSPGTPSAPLAVATVYTRPGCHLCEEMKAVVARVAASVPLIVEQVDISGDPELEARYGLEIPVLLIDGQKAAKYRIGETELRRLVENRRGAKDGADGGRRARPRGPV